MIKTIVFDMGNVLIHWNPKMLIERLGCTDENDVNMLLTELFGSAEWVCLDRGTMPKDTAIERVCRRLPEHLHAIAGELIRGWWTRELVHMDGMAELIAELKAAGYGLYVLSNASSELHNYFHYLPGAEHFDGRLVSADVKLVKPEHEIYELFYNTFELEPAECIFIDDNPANIEAAWRTGMEGIVFRKDANRLRRELRECGINI